ncbi:MAG: CSLREA domain-containing protein [Thermodesulfobacteriota bacterium]|nr:MAG: CSLREA domain-containing protein [Thermodesulfobacteriota bacterium]
MTRLFNLLKDLEVPSLTTGIMIFALTLLVVAGSIGANAATFEVNSTVDAVDDNPGDGICDDGSGNCTLRAAVMETNDLAGSDEIVLKSKTYVLTIPGPDAIAEKGDLDIRDDLLIQGQGTLETVIDGNLITRVFHLLDGDDMNQIDVEVYDLTIRNSDAGNAGGGIRNVAEKLFLYRVALENNTSPRGAGLYNGPDGDTTIRDSVIFNNTATGDPDMERGGGIYNKGELFLGNSTVSNNSAGDLGGGIFNEGSIHAAFSTIADNTTESGLPGGVHTIFGGDLSLFANIIADNNDGNCGGILPTSQGFNISSSNCNLNDPTDMPNTDPMIGPLQNNGGNTWTHALLSSSPAIDMAGNEFACFEVGADQRGIIRPQDGDQIGEAFCDAGAFEFKANLDSGEGGGCSIAKPGSSAPLPLYLLIPVFLLVIRLFRKQKINA